MTKPIDLTKLEQDITSRQLTASEQETTLTAQQKEVVRTIWQTLAEVYGSTLVKQYGEVMPEAWITLLKGLTPSQIKDGLNGFLIDSEEEAAARVVQLMRDESLRQKLGAEAKKSTMKQFLMIRLLENYLDLMASFVPEFKLKPT